MPTEITQTDTPDSDVTILRVSGEMLEEDVTVIDGVATCLLDGSGRRVVIDIANLDLIDSDAAPLLKKLGERDGISIEGIEIFLQAVIDQAERQAT